MLRYLVLLVLCGFVFADVVSDNHGHADAAIQSYLTRFWNSGAGGINSAYPSTGSLTQYWNFAQAFDAILDAVERTHSLQYYGWISTFYNYQNKIGFNRDWYDDENWMGLALVRAYDIAMAKGDVANAPRYLNTAILLLEDIGSAWDTTVRPGIWWDKAHTQKATAANAGPSILAARLYQRTGNQKYATWAEYWFENWNSNCVSSTFQVADHIVPATGELVWWGFTYNNALMVGAATELYKISGKPRYLTLARNFANFMVNSQTTNSPYGKVLTDGTSANCGGDCIEFKGPSYRYLMRLYQTDPANTANVYNVLQASAASIWNTARDSSRNLFAINWVETLASSASVTDQQQHVACMALSLWAQNNGTYPGANFAANTFEAENGELIGIGLETSQAGFSGWAYLAGWGSNGQSVKILFKTTATSYTITYRYATGGNAVRKISINGAVVAAQFNFPSTGGYGTYGTVKSATFSGAIGWHTLTVAFDSSASSTNYINLDNIAVN